MDGKSEMSVHKGDVEGKGRGEGVKVRGMRG